MDIFEKIDNIQASVFDYEVATVPNNVANVFSETLAGGYVDAANAERVGALNRVMAACLDALGRKDYLLLADLLEYELKPFLGARV
jgi:hypothetical protein